MELDRSEQRAVIAQFFAYGPETVRATLDAFPSQRRRYVARLVRDWGVHAQGEEWDALVAAAGELREGDVPVRGLPLRGASLLRFGAPTLLASEHSKNTVEEFVQALSAGGFKPQGPYVAECILRWFLLRRKAKRRMGSALEWVLNSPDARNQLLPRTTDIIGKGTPSTRNQVAFTALVLGAHVTGLVSESELEPFERLLLSPSSEFGDPRLPGVNRAWEEVKRIEPEGYASLVERLNAEDLQFFFDKSMDDAKDRREFWLRYVGAIRRTRCVLDAETVRKIQRQSPLLSLRLRQAFHRADRFTGTDDASAFCMWFDDHVIIEFSQTNNAAYVYRIETFDKHVLRELNRPKNADAIKVRTVSHVKWSHTPGWEARFDIKLRQIGIKPTRRRQS